MKHLKVGITGGIGSGKSTVSRALTIMGYPVYNSDDRAKELMSSDPDLKQRIQELFGNDIYNERGELDRPRVAKSIFGNEELKQAMNNIVHPAVRADFLKWTEQQSSPLVFQESALLFETGGHKLFDHTLLVTAPEEVRLNRVLKRDKTDRESIVARMRNQLPEEQKMPLAGTVIVNDDQHALLPQLLKFIEQLRATN